MPYDIPTAMAEAVHQARTYAPLEERRRRQAALFDASSAATRWPGREVFLSTLESLGSQDRRRGLICPDLAYRGLLATEIAEGNGQGQAAIGQHRRPIQHVSGSNAAGRSVRE